MRHILFLSIITFSFSSCDYGCPDDDTAPEPDISMPSPIYPLDFSEEIGRSPVFVWKGRLADDYDGSYFFTLEFRVSGASEHWHFPAGRDTIFYYPDTLDSETYYAWRVNTEGSGGRSSPSSYYHFTTGTGFNNPPGLPVLIYPPQQGIDIPLDITMLWSFFDPDGDDLTYAVWYRRDEDADSIHVSDLTEPEYYVMLDADTKYEWKGYAYDEDGAMAKSTLNRFYTINTIPPHAPHPADGAEDVPTDLILSWSCTDPDGDDLTYNVEMGRAGGSMASIGTGLTQDELPVVGLSDGVTYEWKVTAEDDDDHRTEGPVWTFTTVGAAGDVFADLTLTRKQTSSITEVIVIDNIWARFDEGYAPQWALRPLQPDAVSCSDIDLAWQDSKHRYYYENAHTLTFLVPGNEYTFSIASGDGVPSLTESIVFPQCAPLITNPLAYDPVSMDGFTVTWSGYNDFTDCDRQVSIAILDIMGDSTGVYVTTDNDGSYTFTAGELSVIDPLIMDMQIVLIVENVMNINSPGYDPRSWIRARTLTVQTVYRD